MPLRVLRAWYMNYGFESTGHHNQMARRPKSLTESIALQVNKERTAKGQEFEDTRGLTEFDIVVDGAKVGWASAGKNEHSGDVYISQLHLDDAHQGAGYGEAAIRELMQHYNAPDFQEGQWATEKAGQFWKYMHQKISEARNPDVRVKKFGGGIYRAYLGRTKVGHAQLNDFNSDDVADDERYIWKSAVHPDYLRQGVATELYNVIADDVGAKGLKLVPSPDTQLSKDAYDFWKARDPESIKGHGKYKAEPYQKYIGREIVVTREGGQRPAVVTHVGWGRRDEPDLGIRYTDVPEGSVNSQSQVYLSAVKDQLQ